MSETTILNLTLWFVSLVWLGTLGFLVLSLRKNNKVMSRYMDLKLNHQTLRTNHSSLIGMYASLEKECRETLLKVPLRDLPLGSYAMYEGRRVRLVSRVEDGENAGMVGVRYDGARELKNLSPGTEVVPFQYKGKTE